MERVLLGITAILSIILLSGAASATVLLSDQGTDVKYSSTGALLAKGNLTILIYNSSAGVNPLYNHTFENAISNGSWNVMIDPDIEFGKSYWKDYAINGEDLDFNGSEKLEFQSPLGPINNASFINFSMISEYINSTNASYVTWSRWNLTNASYDELLRTAMLYSTWNATNASYMLYSAWNSTNASYISLNATNWINNIINATTGWFFNLFGNTIRAVTAIFAPEGNFTSISAGYANLSKADVSGNLSVGGNNLFVDNSTGNVGIGTTTPSYKLTVNGSINVSPGMTWTRALQMDWTGTGYHQIYGEAVFNDYLYVGIVQKTADGGAEMWKTSDGSNWTQSGTAGFGDSANTFFKFSMVFNDYLYVGTVQAGAEVWRTAGDDTWTQVNTDGFDDDNNSAANAGAVFKGYMYWGTTNSATGGEIWRTADGTTWERVVNEGFDGDANNKEISYLIVFNNYLYAGVENNVDGIEIWRTNDGATWSKALTTNGFDGSDNSEPHAMEVFRGYLYVATENSNTGGEIWKTLDGTTWTRVANEGFNSTIKDFKELKSYNGYLYAGTYKNTSTPAEIWRSSDGTTWTEVDTGLNGDSTIVTISGFEIFKGYLFTLTAKNSFPTQVEVWKMETGLYRSDGYVDAMGFTDGLLRIHNGEIENLLSITGRDASFGTLGGGVTSLADNSSSTLLTLQQDGSGDIVNIFDGATEVFTILNAGNVGIGTATPANKLNVIGGINATTQVIAPMGNFTSISTNYINFSSTNYPMNQTNESYVSWFKWNITNSSYDTLLRTAMLYSTWNTTNTSYLLYSAWNSTNTTYALNTTLATMAWNQTNESYVQWAYLNGSYMLYSAWNSTNASYISLNATNWINNIINATTGWFFNLFGNTIRAVTAIFAPEGNFTSISAGYANLSKADVSGNLSVGGNNLFVDNSTGNVGIGTATPANKLNVIGGINATGNITIGSFIYQDDDSNLTVWNATSRLTCTSKATGTLWVEGCSRKV